MIFEIILVTVVCWLFGTAVGMVVKNALNKSMEKEIQKRMKELQQSATECAKLDTFELEQQTPKKDKHDYTEIK